MDFVYICRSGNNEELRYSIRSVIDNFPNAKVWVVGGKPDWYIGNYIEVDQSLNQYTNAINNLKAICNSKEIKESFILMNDDFFIMEKIKKIKYFYSGFLEDKIEDYKEMAKESSYIVKLSETNNRLKKYKIEKPLDYELHIPFPMKKNKLKQILEKDYRFLWRSMYGNIYSVGGTQMKDVKIYTSSGLIKKSFDYENNKTIFLSTTEESFLKIFEMLKNMFPEPTIYETK